LLDYGDVVVEKVYFILLVLEEKRFLLLFESMDDEIGFKDLMNRVALFFIMWVRIFLGIL
jgi:hypothetical protein